MMQTGGSYAIGMSGRLHCGAFVCAPVCFYDDPYYHGREFDRSRQFCSCFMALDCGDALVRSGLELALRLQSSAHKGMEIRSDERYLNVAFQSVGVEIGLLDNRWNWGKRPGPETMALHAAEMGINKAAWLGQWVSYLEA